MISMSLRHGKLVLFGWIYTNSALVDAIVTCEYSWGDVTFTHECRDGFECCEDNRNCCKTPNNPEEYLTTGVLVGIILSCILLVFLVVSLAVALKCGANKRLRRLVRTRQRTNAVASITMQLPPPYELSGYTPPPYRGTGTNTQGTTCPDNSRNNTGGLTYWNARSNIQENNVRQNISLYKLSH